MVLFVPVCNSLLHPFSAKSNTCSEFTKLCFGGISIITNSAPAPSDLSIIEKHFKLINGINEEKSFSSCLPQSKSYLKITSILFIQPNSNKLTHEDIINFIQHSTLFKTVSLTSKPRVIKALPKSDITIVWIDVWDF